MLRIYAYASVVCQSAEKYSTSVQSGTGIANKNSFDRWRYLINPHPPKGSCCNSLYFFP